MARFEYAVFVPAFLLSVLLSPFYLTNAANLEDSTTASSLAPHPTKTGLPTGLTHRNGDVEDMEASLAVNQLAILHILTGESSGSECERTPEVEGLSEVLDNLRSIKGDLVVLRESQATFQWRLLELREGLIEIKESQAQIRVEVNVLEGSMGDLKENHVMLNDTLITHKTSLNRLERNVSVHDDSLDTVTDRLGSLDGHVGTLKTQLGSLDGHVGTLNNQLGSLDGHVGTLKNQLGSLDGHVGNLTCHIDTLDSHVETVHNITIIQNITVTTMIEDIQTLQDNDKVFQNFTNHLREEFDGHVEDIKWKQYAGSLFHHEGHRFLVNKDTLNWAESHHWCQARGGDLAQPTGNLAMFLQEVLRHAPPVTSSAQGVWLAASDEVEEGEWKWLSGSSIPSDFPWGKNQPNNYGNQDCLEILYRTSDNTRMYNDRECSFLKYSVCEM